MLRAAAELAFPCCVRRRGGSPDALDAKGFGHHDIGFIGGLCLLTNNILSSAMVQIPGLFQQSGWALPTAAFVLTAAWSCACALLLARVMTRMLGNGRFERRVEFANVLEEIFPRWLYVASLVALVATFVASNISNVVVSAQVADDILLVAVGRTCAVVLYPPPAGGASPFQCVAAGDLGGAQIADSPFGSAYTISAGFALVALVCVPLSYVSIDNNIVYQVVGVGLNALCVFIWAANFTALGLNTANMPAFAPQPGGGSGGGGGGGGGSGGGGGGSWIAQAYGPLLPTVLFNYGFVATCPSWANEKGPGVSVTRTFAASCVLATFLYLLLGFFGALSPLNFSSSGADVLTVLVNSDTPGIWVSSQVAAYVFPAANLMTSIPIFSVMVRYNLVNGGLMPVWAANAVAVGGPWLLSLVFYSGNQLSELINWSSALFFAFVNLTLPAALFLRQRELDREDAALRAGARGDDGGDGGGGDDEGGDGDEIGDGDGGVGREIESEGAAKGLFALKAMPSAVSVPLLLIRSSLNSDAGADAESEGGGPLGAGLAGLEEAEDIRPTTACCRRAGVDDARLAAALLGLSVVVGLLSLVLQAYSEYEQDNPQ